MKKQFLELLIKSYGLEPSNVRHYRTESCGGAHQVTTGWEGQGMDYNKQTVIDFATPEGFYDAVYEILTQAKDKGLTPVCVA